MLEFYTILLVYLFFLVSQWFHTFKSFSNLHFLGPAFFLHQRFFGIGLPLTIVHFNCYFTALSRSDPESEVTITCRRLLFLLLCAPKMLNVKCIENLLHQFGLGEFDEVKFLWIGFLSASLFSQSCSSFIKPGKLLNWLKVCRRYPISKVNFFWWGKTRTGMETETGEKAGTGMGITNRNKTRTWKHTIILFFFSQCFFCSYVYTFIMYFWIFM